MYNNNRITAQVDTTLHSVLVCMYVYTNDVLYNPTLWCAAIGIKRHLLATETKKKKEAKIAVQRL